MINEKVIKSDQNLNVVRPFDFYFMSAMEDCRYFESPKKETLEQVVFDDPRSESESESESELQDLSCVSVPVGIVLLSEGESVSDAWKDDPQMSQLIETVRILQNSGHRFRKDFGTIESTIFPVLESLYHHQKEMRTGMNQMKDEMHQMKCTLQNVVREISTLVHESKQLFAANLMWCQGRGSVNL
jgi:hypothetical protein